MSKKNLNDWLNHYERLHPIGIDMGLERVAKVWGGICDKYDIKSIAKKKVITVAGTNGKGSACQMLSMLLSSEGHSVGMYTSPHIFCFNERVKINNEMVDDATIVNAFEVIEEFRESISLSYFEATTLAGLLIFALQEVDYAVLEVGLGGRLDAINIINADAALITSIGLDHEGFLGNDLGCIAVEKAGVFRKNKPAVYAQKENYRELIDYTLEQGLSLCYRGKDYSVTKDSVIFKGVIYYLPANLVELGEHQVSNAAGVIITLLLLDLLPDGFNQILTGFSVAGRLQKIDFYPDVVVDVAHNEAAAIALADYLSRKKDSYQKIIAVIGMLADKDHSSVLAAFDGIFDFVYCGSTLGERGYSGQALACCVDRVLSVPTKDFENVKQALDAAKNVSGTDDLIIAFGSFLVAEALIND